VAATAFSDLVNKSPVYAAYMEAMLPEKIQLVRSGAVSINPRSDVVGEFSRHGGKTFSIPFYKEISQSHAELLTANTNLTRRAMTTGADIGVVCARGLAMSGEDIAAIFAGTDPVREAARQMSNFWARQLDTSLIKVLTGAIASETAYQLDKSAQEFSPDLLIDAADILGDEGDSLSIVIMHSKVAHKLQKANILTYPNATDVGANHLLREGRIGQRVVFVTDQAPVASSVYSTFLLRPGAMSLYYQKNLKLEANREPLLAGGTDDLVSTIHYVPHLNYIKWIGTASGTTPTDTELATSGNWDSVAGNTKDVGAVEIKSLATL